MAERRYSKLDEVIQHIHECAPFVATEMEHEVVADIVRDTRSVRYEEIDEAEFDRIYDAVMTAYQAGQE